MNVPISVIVRVDGAAGAVPRFGIVMVFLVSEPTTRSGSGVTIVQLWVAGPLVLPAASVAVTENACEPTASAVYDAGLAQAVNAAPSSEQANDDPGSFDENVKLAEVTVVGDGGPDPIVTTGGVVSGGVYVQVTDTGLPTFPALSLPLTENRCSPAERAVSATGLAQFASAAPSREQENETPPSLATKPISAASVEVAAAGALVIVTTGAVVSGGGAGGFDVVFGSGAVSGFGVVFGFEVVFGFGLVFGFGSAFGFTVRTGPVVGGDVTAVVGGTVGSGSAVSDTVGGVKRKSGRCLRPVDVDVDRVQLDLGRGCGDGDGCPGDELARRSPCRP